MSVIKNGCVMRVIISVCVMSVTKNGMSVIKKGCVIRVIWLCYVSDKERLCYESDVAVLC